MHTVGVDSLLRKSDRQNLGKDPFSPRLVLQLPNHHIGKGAPIHRPGCLGVMLDHEKWSLAWGGVGMGWRVGVWVGRGGEAHPYRAWLPDGDGLATPFKKLPQSLTPSHTQHPPSQGMH